MIRKRTVLQMRPAQQSSQVMRTQDANKTAGGCLDNVSLAMVYSPVQRFEDLYSPEEALCKGTLFKQLYLPFHAGFRI